MSGKPLMTRLEIHGHGPGALALHRMLQREGWEGDTGLRERQQVPDGHTTAQALQAAQASLATRSLALSAGSLQLIKACTGSIPAGSDITCVEVQIGARAARAVGEGLVMRCLGETAQRYPWEGLLMTLVRRATTRTNVQPRARRRLGTSGFGPMAIRVRTPLKKMLISRRSSVVFM
jgi:hypothetical protein